MRRLNAVSGCGDRRFAAFAGPRSADVTAFEGARLIVGNGSVIENGTLVIDGNKIVQAGRVLPCPAGATRVNLAGKTVMPAIIDSHVHLSANRERLIRDLKQRGYWGVGAALSMGTDNLELLPMRSEVIPGAARSSAPAAASPGRSRCARRLQIETEEEGPQGCPRECRAEGPDHQGLGRRPRRQGSEGHAGAICRRHRRGAQGRHPRHSAHLQHGRRQGSDARQPRRLRAWRPRQGRR